MTSWRRLEDLLCRRRRTTSPRRLKTSSPRRMFAGRRSDKVGFHFSKTRPPSSDNNFIHVNALSWDKILSDHYTLPYVIKVAYLLRLTLPKILPPD